jgi:hypothetical protein
MLGRMDFPAEPELRWILRRTAELLELGAEPVRGLVLPTGEFFPDRFDGSPESVAALLARVQHHAGLGDLESEVAVVQPDGEAHKAPSCSSGDGGCCGGGGHAIDAKLDRVKRNDDGSYTVAVGAGETKHSVALTTALVRAVTFMFLTEVDGYDGVPRDEREALTDLCASLLGFGVLISNGSYIYSKGCGGVTVQSATRMPVGETAVALAIFCHLHQVPERLAAKHLEVTPAAQFDEAAAWASSNASVLRRLRADPRAIVADDYSLSEARSWLARKLGFGRSKAGLHAPTDDDLAALEQDLKASAKKGPVDEAKAKRLAELRALVDETLR